MFALFDQATLNVAQATLARDSLRYRELQAPLFDPVASFVHHYDEAALAGQRCSERFVQVAHRDGHRQKAPLTARTRSVHAPMIARRASR